MLYNHEYVMSICESGLVKANETVTKDRIGLQIESGVCLSIQCKPISILGITPPKPIIDVEQNNKERCKTSSWEVCNLF